MAKTVLRRTCVCCYAFFRLAWANVLITNQGYCDLEVFRVTKKGRRYLGQLFARSTTRYHSLRHKLKAGAKLEFGQRQADTKEGMWWLYNITTPGVAPTPEHAYHGLLRTAYVTTSNRSWIDRFHTLDVSADDPNCAKPLPLTDADSRPAYLMLVLTCALLVMSFCWSGAGAEQLERMGWVVVLVIFYIVGMRSVYRTSAQYMQRLEEWSGTNPINGDRIWGLHGDYKSISWVFGTRRWDLKDLQYYHLVKAFPLISGIAVLYLSIKHVGSWMAKGRAEKAQRSVRLWLTLVPALSLAIFLHEATLLVPLGIVFVHYLVIMGLSCCGTRAQALIPITSWVIALSALIASADGRLKLVVVLGRIAGPAGAKVGAFLDGFKGELAWHQAFNFIVLHMISWAVDFHRSLAASSASHSSSKSQITSEVDENSTVPTSSARGEAPESQSQDERRESAAADNDTAAPLDERSRVEHHRSGDEYRSLCLYFAYIFYPPTYLAGPIITFNAFASYMQVPQSDCVGWSLGRYALRCVFNAFLLVLFGHFFYTFAITTNGPVRVWGEDEATVFHHLFKFGQDGESLIWYSYWALKGLWFKFLVVWRFARLWALADGVSPPENMNRCMSNNFTVRGFWRAWHRSFNRWLVRYIFVVIGGSRGVSLPRRMASILIVFTFVAVWHEPGIVTFNLQMLRVLAWGWLMFLFMVPEVVADQVYRISRVQSFMKRRPLLDRHLKALGGALCIEMLMVANLIGYSYGLRGAQELLSTCSQRSMIVFIAAYTAWLFAGAQWMMHIRRLECAKLASKEF